MSGDIIKAMTISDKASVLFTYGDKIPRKWVDENLGIETPESGKLEDVQRWMWEKFAAVELFKHEMLSKHKMYLRTVRGEGFEVVHPKDQAGYAMENLEKRVSAEIRKARDVIDNVRLEMLEDEDIRRRDDAAARLAAIKALGLTKK